jgi:hypothetical protein
MRATFEVIRALLLVLFVVALIGFGRAVLRMPVLKPLWPLRSISDGLRELGLKHTFWPLSWLVVAAISMVLVACISHFFP